MVARIKRPRYDLLECWGQRDSCELVFSISWIADARQCYEIMDPLNWLDGVARSRRPRYELLECSGQRDSREFKRPRNDLLECWGQRDSCELLFSISWIVDAKRSRLKRPRYVLLECWGQPFVVPPATSPGPILVLDCISGANDTFYHKRCKCICKHKQSNVRPTSDVCL